MAEANISPDAILREHEGLLEDIRFGKTQQWEISKVVVTIFVGVVAAYEIVTSPGKEILLVKMFFTVCGVLATAFGWYLIKLESEGITTARERFAKLRELMDPQLTNLLGSTPLSEKRARLSEITVMMKSAFIIGLLILLFIIWKSNILAFISQ